MTQKDRIEEATKPADAETVEQAADPTTEPQLSRRAQDALKHSNPLIDALLAKVLGDQYSPETPNGLMNAGVAENSLMADWLLDYYHKNLTLTQTDLTYGDALTGSKRLHKALSTFFKEYFHAREEVKSEHIVCGVGVSAIVDQLSEKLCDEGDSIMTVRPYYNGFDVDTSAGARVKMMGVEIPADIDPSSPATLEHFEAKVEDLKSQGKKLPKAVILCNPNNPKGFIYPKETILAYCRFCQKYNMHLISDEIYALSIYKNKANPNPPPFTSLLSIDVKEEAQCDPARVHVIYGMSKDFGSNGLRIGVLVSQHNKPLMKAFMGSAIFMKVSSPADALWTSILNNEQVLNSYLEEAQSRASDALDYSMKWLDKMSINHSNPTAGHFIWIDLREYLPKKDKKGKQIDTNEAREWELFTQLLDDGNVYLAPGVIYHATIPGFFRLTFTLRREYLKIALERVESILLKIKKENEL